MTEVIAAPGQAPPNPRLLRAEGFISDVIQEGLANGQITEPVVTYDVRIGRELPRRYDQNGDLLPPPVQDVDLANFGKWLWLEGGDHAAEAYRTRIHVQSGRAHGIRERLARLALLLPSGSYNTNNQIKIKYGRHMDQILRHEAAHRLQDVRGEWQEVGPVRGFFYDATRYMKLGFAAQIALMAVGLTWSELHALYYASWLPLTMQAASIGVYRTDANERDAFAAMRRHNDVRLFTGNRKDDE